MPNLEPVFDQELLKKLCGKEYKHDWRTLLEIAYKEAKKSPDPSTQNGALLINDNGTILVAGHNRFPRGVEGTPKRWEKPLKYELIQHAERAAIFKASRKGIPTDGLIMVCCWATCGQCAGAIIDAGIKLLVTHKQAYDRSPEFWKKSIDPALEELEEAGVRIIWYDGKIGGVEGLRHSGQIWNP